MKRLMMAGLILAAALSGASASAQQPGMVIAFLDKTGDGKCDLQEYLTYQTTRIAEVDKDGDGELNLSEFRESLQGRAAKQNAGAVFNSSNREGGRTLTQREFLGYQAWVFKTFIDKDHDGFMSAEEWTDIVNRAS